MNATPVNKEAVRMLVMTSGYKVASKQTGIKEPTIRQWAHREKWFAAPPAHVQAVKTVTKAPADALADELSQNERQTRLSLSRYTARAARDAEQATLREAKNVKDLAGTAAITYQWQNGKGSDQSQVAVNIAILGV